MSWLSLRTLWLPPRSQQQEWLDADDLPAQDLRDNLHDLRRLNRYLGSYWLLRTAVRRVWRRAGCPRQLRVLDIGTGAGDIPELLLSWGRRQGLHLTVVAIDNHRGVIQYTRAAWPTSLPVTLVQADGLCLPFAARSFDVVVCSTMLHHLDWQQGIRLLHGMATVARYGVVINDLRRSWLHYFAARLLLAVLARHPVTRHDGPLSVLRAYSPGEVHEMACLAGLESAQVYTALGYRLLLVYVPPAGQSEARHGR